MIRSLCVVTKKELFTLLQRCFMMKKLLITLWKHYMIKILKLVTGEELLGDASEVANQLNQITLVKPCILQLVPSRSNPEQVGMALIPYATYAKDHTIIIDKDCIVWEQEPVDEVRNQYNSVFGSGIVLAKNLIN